MQSTSHTKVRPFRTVTVPSDDFTWERRTIRARRPGRGTDRRAAIAEQLGVRR